MVQYLKRYFAESKPAPAKDFRIFFDFILVVRLAPAAAGAANI